MESLWERERHPVPRRELPATAEAVVVGGGLVGVAIALELARQGRRPLIVERARLGAGASAHNGGLLLPGAPESYDALVSRWGRDDARLIYAAYDAGARTLVEWIGDDEVDCEWRGEGAYHGAVDAAEAEQLRAVAGDLAADGFEATWVEATELEESLARPPAGILGALLLPHGGPLHSGRLVTGLARRAVELGATLVEEAAVTALSATPDGARVSTTAGDVSCDAAVVATNAWTPALLPELDHLLRPVRGQVLATDPLPRQLEGAWSVNRGYEYAQQLADGRVVAGGLRWTAPDRETDLTAPDLNDDIQGRIESWLASFLGPGAAIAVAQRWAGLMAWTPDRLPLVGPAPERERVYVAAGFNGHGLPAAPMAAAQMRALLSGDEPPVRPALLAPDRFGDTVSWGIV